MNPPATSSWWQRFWRERVVAVIVAQLKQGITPGKIALSIALGFTLGIFPIIGASTALCLLAGIILKLNQPLLLLINSFTVPLQPAMVLVFVRMGERLLHAPPVTFSIPELFHKFFADPVEFFREFGLTGLHGIFAWSLVAPAIVALIYYLTRPPLRRLGALLHPASPVETPAP
jgi:uncharacterized protein (DUF2062 family)